MKKKMKKIKKTVTPKLKAFRLKNELEQAQLAKASNVSVTYLSLIENGKKTPSENMAMRLVAGYKKLKVKAPVNLFR